MTRQDPQLTRELKHIAIIMDGNGRWAKKRGLPRTAGHKRGVETVKEVVRAATELAIPCLTLFTFSSENWSRPKPEIDELMRLMKTFLEREQDDLIKNNIKLKMIGAPLDEKSEVYNLIKNVEQKTEQNSGMQLTVAFNYGGRDEIVRATKRLAKDIERGALKPEDITEDLFAAKLDSHGLPDPDLLIRTSGEVRISNFLLWQLAYTEFVFLDCNWPEFNRDKLAEAIDVYYARNRRFGGVMTGTAV